ncbi:MAG: hypothetical protein KBS95_04745 [Alistipes sp.]|nr:hypothetical protein [Candidatus Alistipes equi]
MKTMRLSAIFAAIFLATLLCAEPIILSHRGYYTENGKTITDENSLEALKRAQQANQECIEFDVHLTLDDQIVIRHDAKLSKTLNCQKNTFDELRQFTLPFGNKLPSLEEWLTQAKKSPNMTLVIEIKKHSKKREEILVEKVMEAVRKHNLQDRVIYMSFQLHSCKQIVKLDPTAKSIYISSKVHETLSPDEAKALGLYGISYRIDVFLNHVEWIKRCQEIGIKSDLWMVNSKFLADLSLELGVDIIATDYPDLITGYVSQYKSKLKSQK